MNHPVQTFLSSELSPININSLLFSILLSLFIISFFHFIYLFIPLLLIYHLSIYLSIYPLSSLSVNTLCPFMVPTVSGEMKELIAIVLISFINHKEEISY
jgi:hypothetical protein